MYMALKRTKWSNMILCTDFVHGGEGRGGWVLPQCLTSSPFTSTEEPPSATASY